jgi:hypothetical protein
MEKTGELKLFCFYKVKKRTNASIHLNRKGGFFERKQSRTEDPLGHDVQK